MHSSRSQNAPLEDIFYVYCSLEVQIPFPFPPPLQEVHNIPFETVEIPPEEKCIKLTLQSIATSKLHMSNCLLDTCTHPRRVNPSIRY